MCDLKRQEWNLTESDVKDNIPITLSFDIGGTITYENKDKENKRATMECFKGNSSLTCNNQFFNNLKENPNNDYYVKFNTGSNTFNIEPFSNCDRNKELTLCNNTDFNYNEFYCEANAYKYKTDPPPPPKKNICNADPNNGISCNVCSSCCYNYIQNGPNCDKCVKHLCERDVSLI